MKNLKSVLLWFGLVGGVIATGSVARSNKLAVNLSEPVRRKEIREILWQRQDCQVKEPREEALFQSRLQNVEPEISQNLTRHFLWLCKKYRFDPVFVAALIGVESGFDPEAVSSQGALGLMQVMPETAAWILERDGGDPEWSQLARQLADPFFNLTLGIKYLAFLRDRYRGDADRFLPAYHAGPGRMDEVLRGKRRLLASSREYVRSVRIGMGLMRLEVPRACSERTAPVLKARKT